MKAAEHFNLSKHGPKARTVLELIALALLLFFASRALHTCLYEAPPDQPAPFLR